MRQFFRPPSRGVFGAVLAVIGIFAFAAALLSQQNVQSFSITSINATNNNVRITWDSPGGRNYIVQTATNLVASNFADLSPVMFVPVGVASTNYTHTAAVANARSRFYRVRSTNAGTLQIYPTNAVIGVTMTNRYKVFFIYPDNSSQDVTAGATLTVLGNIAQTAGLSADGFALVRGTNGGTGSVRAVYQSLSNTVPLTISQLTGMYTIPPLAQLNSYVGTGNPVQVMGVFSNGQTNNITPSSNLIDLFGGPINSTRVDYTVTANVANSYALVTGQSAATGSAMVVAADQTNTFNFNWCWFTSVSLQPQSAQLSTGQAWQYSIIGQMQNGSNVNVLAYIPSYQITLSADDTNVALVDTSSFIITPVAPGTTTLRVNAYNGPGFFCAGGLDASTPITVAAPPSTTAFWTNIYNGPGDRVDQAVAIALDPGGNPSITGYSYGGAGSDYDYVTIRYTSAGTPSWTRRFNGANGTDTPVAITTDLSSNVLVTGYAVNSGNYNWATIKYSVSGTSLWTNQYNGPANSFDEPAGIAVDTNGNVFVAGWATSATSADFATIKYSGAGVPLWTNFYNSPANNGDEAVAIAQDTGGNPIVTGNSLNGGGFYDFVTIKYSNAGTPLWTNRYDGPSHASDSPTAMAVDSNDNVFVTGYSYANGSDADFVTIEYSSTGTPLWTNTFNGPASQYDAPAAITVDNKGDVVVTGSTTDSDGHTDCLTIKYSATGAPLWTNRYNASINGGDYGRGVAVDSLRNVVVTGSSDFGGATSDFFTIKYSSAGALVWLAHYGGGIGSAVAIDSSRNVFATGSGTNINTYYDCATLKYHP